METKMRARAVLIILTICSSAYAEGVLKRWGADGPISQRFDGTPQQEIVIINGQRYLVQRGQSGDAALPRSAIDPRTGQVYPGVGGGVINPRNGQFYPDVGAGYIDPATGRFMPKH